MKNIIDICKSFGIEIPEDKQKEFIAEVSENYTTKAEHEKKLGKIEAERDRYKADAETAAETLKGFDGVDVKTIQAELETWKKKAEDAEKDYNNKLAEREKADLLKEAMSGIEFTSESARRAVMADIEKAVTVKNGKLIGFNDLIEEAKKSDSGAFVNKEQQQLENNRVQFTEGKKQDSNKPVTKESILAIKDKSERQQAIANNLSLFQG